MKKEEIIARYGEERYKKQLEQSKSWNVKHRNLCNIASQKWRKGNPKKIGEWKNKHPRSSTVAMRIWRKRYPVKAKIAHNKCNRKGGKYYERKKEYNATGVQGERNKIRGKHGRVWRRYKRIIAPASELHHEWGIGTSEYAGLALVERNAHRYGMIKVIEILEGEITLFSEKEKRRGR